jgi:hypothetical protein
MVRRLLIIGGSVALLMSAAGIRLPRWAFPAVRA